MMGSEDVHQRFVSAGGAEKCTHSNEIPPDILIHVRAAGNVVVAKTGLALEALHSSKQFLELMWR